MSVLLSALLFCCSLWSCRFCVALSSLVLYAFSCSVVVRFCFIFCCALLFYIFCALLCFVVLVVTHLFHLGELVQWVKIVKIVHGDIDQSIIMVNVIIRTL